MEKLRCPTCLTMLDGGEQRCPACHSRLRKRGQPIVLGEASRITSRPLFPFERAMRARVEASSEPDHPWHRPHISPATGPSRPQPLAPAPESEPLEALLAFEANIPAEPARDPDAYRPAVIDLTAGIDLTAEPAPDRPPVATPDIHEIFEALHRKARAQADEPAPELHDALSVSPATTRATRRTAERGPRRWRPARRLRSGPDDS